MRNASKRLSTELGRKRRPGPHWLGDTLQVFGSKVLKFEQVAEELSRALSDDDGVRFSNSLQARRKVRRLADDAALLRCSRSDQIADDDQPRGNAHAGLKWASRLQCAHGLDQLQSRPYRPLSVILVRLRIAEVHEDAVAHVLGYEPAKRAARSRRRTSDRPK